MSRVACDRENNILVSFPASLSFSQNGCAGDQKRYRSAISEGHRIAGNVHARNFPRRDSRKSNPRSVSTEGDQGARFSSAILIRENKTRLSSLRDLSFENLSSSTESALKFTDGPRETRSITIALLRCPVPSPAPRPCLSRNGCKIDHLRF